MNEQLKLPLTDANPHPCIDCGDETLPAGACRICPQCGSSTGCS